MKKTFHRLSIWFFYFQTCLTLASSEKVIAVAGEKIILPCDVRTQGDIRWNKNESPLLRYSKSTKTSFGNKIDMNRFNVLSHNTNDLEVTDVQLLDSGTFTCAKEKSIVRTVELVVFEVSASPSPTLLVSENLELNIRSSPVMTLQVSWWKNGNLIKNGTNLPMNNVQIEYSGSYMCQIKMDDGTEKKLSTEITVKGFQPSPAIVYISRKQPITIPFIFNFKVRETPLENDVSVVAGNIKYLSKILKKLTVNSGAACWLETCNSKVPLNASNDLNVYLSNPKTGHYQMEIFLKIQNREKRLLRDVCVTNLTVSTSLSYIRMESNVTLLCNISCLHKDGKLCWYHSIMGYEICGQVGQQTLAKNVTTLPGTAGNWTCSVIIGMDRIVSANLTLEVQPDFLDPANYLFWVTVVAGILVLLVIGVIITIMTARCRRVRRARYRAWLLENLHQQRRCQCKEFAPQRLRENI